jgi:hypothetical protein
MVPLNTHILNFGSSRADNEARNFSLRDMLHLLRDPVWTLLAFIAFATFAASPIFLRRLPGRQSFWSCTTSGKSLLN